MFERVTEAVPAKHLSVAYITNRREPMIHWFLDSLHRQCEGGYDGLQVIVVDRWAEEPGRKDDFAKLAHCGIIHVEPHPNVWNGRFRIAGEDYFAVAAARNTSICLAQDGYIAFVDDISVLMPGWLSQIREAMSSGWIACGAYRKVFKLVVENGLVTSFEDHPKGWDCRWRTTRAMDPTPCGGGDMFGCSMAAPVEAFLQVNGFDEDCDSMGSEDYVTGIMLGKSGYHIKYCQRMLTYESEEMHHIEPPFRRIIKKRIPGTSHFAEIDASHAILGLLRNGRTTAPNYFPGGLRGERERVLRGEPFTVIQSPEHDWRDSMPIRGMSRANDGCP